MARKRTYTRDDVQTHAEYFGQARPAVNVKVYRGIHNAWAAFQKDEEPDPRFTLDWIEEHVSEDALDSIFWMQCENEFEYLASWATEDEDAIFPSSRYGRLTVEREGRMGGWAVVGGLPDIEEWDAILLARWRKFERVARDIADNVPVQMLASIYYNEFQAWSDEQDDAAAYNAELPVDQGLA
jgi:hypothetical protein